MKIISFTYFFFFIIINFKSLIILFIYKVGTYTSSTYYEYTYDSLYNNFLVFSVKFSEETLLCKKSLSNKINLDISEAICLWATSRVRSPSSRRNRNRPRGARGARRGGWVGSRKKWKMLSRFVTTSRTRIINPRYVVPCTLYLLVITAPSLSLLSRSTTSSWAKDGGRVAARGVAARGREHTYDFFFTSHLRSIRRLRPFLSGLKEKCSLHATDLARSPLGGDSPLCAASTPGG